MNGMNYESLENLRLVLNEIIDKMTDSAKGAQDIINKMDNKEHWDGLGYDNYNNKFTALVSNFLEYLNEIYKLNNNIKASIKRYRDIDRKVSESILNIN